MAHSLAEGWLLLSKKIVLDTPLEVLMICLALCVARQQMDSMLSGAMPFMVVVFFPLLAL